MISKIKVELDLSNPMPAFILEDTTKEEIEKNGVKVFIPNLMAKIPRSKPAKLQVRTNGISTFSNDSSCKPAVSRVLKENNYMIAYKKDDSSLEALLENNILKKDTKVQVEFVLQKFSEIVFS